MTRSPKTGRKLDRDTLRRAMQAVERIQPRDLARRPDTDTGVRPRAAVQKEFREAILPILDHVERLQHEFIPEALLTSPCGFCREPVTLRTPVANLVACYDGCPMCCEEAKRALRLVGRGLSGKLVSGSFLPPEVIAARNLAVQAIHDRRERQTAPRSFALTPVRNADGSVSFHSTRGSALTSTPAKPAEAAFGSSAGSRNAAAQKPTIRRRAVEPPAPRVRRCLEVFAEWGPDRKIRSPEFCALYKKKFASLKPDDPNLDSMEDNVFRSDMVPALLKFGLRRGGKNGYWLPRDSLGFRLVSAPRE